MDWKSILEAKAQTAHWSDKVPDVSLIHEILDELHRYCPSKQNHVPYEITVMDWSKPDGRHEIFKNTCLHNEFRRSLSLVLTKDLIFSAFKLFFNKKDKNTSSTMHT